MQDPLICMGDYDPAFALACEELGTYMAAGLEAGIF